MNGVLGHDSAVILSNAGPVTTWANEMNCDVNHVPDARLIARPVDLQSNALSLCHGIHNER